VIRHKPNVLDETKTSIKTQQHFAAGPKIHTSAPSDHHDSELRSHIIWVKAEFLAFDSEQLLLQFAAAVLAAHVISLLWDSEPLTLLNYSVSKF